ncbi:L,D-transpeptidase family protein [Methylobacter psychrophilus]|uniref:L,D-transpeptidase family protein n=1 Tax=Methylobacter psychrophilus TaxID=96941 RepID=UPI0021D4C6C8|nr:L,D-transpeptidase family protein [Methylobacter psychrophilus]
MLDSKKLFFSQKSALKSWLWRNEQGISFKKIILVILSRFLVFFCLSFSVQGLLAADLNNQITNPVTDDIATEKDVVVSSVADVDIKAVANENTGLANELNIIFASKQHPYLLLSNFINRAKDLEALYKATDYHLLWLDNTDAEKNILDVLNLLDGAADNGLISASYDTEMLRQKLPKVLAINTTDNGRQLALYDTAISLTLLRFLHDLHYGRVNPQGINYKLDLRGKQLIDLPVLIKESLALGTIKQLPLLVEPKLQQYQKLKTALATYRPLAKKLPAFQLRIAKALNPGENFQQLAELEQFLESVGDMAIVSDSGNQKPTRYSGGVVAGVKKFQLRHALVANGIIGKETVAAMNVPLNQRVKQIELAMERLRWLPELDTGPYLVVNIPAFQLWAFDDKDHFNAEIPSMKVVVGKALKNETPVLMATMSFIDFMPYWNLPYSIVKKEILPKLMQNPDYLDIENMEMVTTFGNEIKAVPFTASSMAELKQGTLKVRQRPGKKNSLGRVKFIFPNKEDVYLHDTPSQSLFNKSRRDFSHGCVRVANPEGLAAFALKNQWNKESIHQALNTPKTQRVILKKPIPVLFFYTTSFFDQNNNLLFYKDIYDHDAVLLEALRKPEDLSDMSIFVSESVKPIEAITAQ